jgi:hypothetical protein
VGLEQPTDLQSPRLSLTFVVAPTMLLDPAQMRRAPKAGRTVRDLMEMRDTFDKYNVTLHSVCENLDMSSPAGRWFFSLMGGQAEYYHEALSENVSMDLDRAVKEGRWINRPKTDFDLVDGLLVPNVDAALVIECFRLRDEGHPYRVIEERTGIKYSTVKSILDSRIYRGEVLRKKKWYPGVHEALASEEEWQSAHRGTAKGVRQSSDPLSGRVTCGLCNRKMVVAQNGKGHVTYKCHHRGKGCAQPSRSNLGLARATVVGLRLVGLNESLRKAIRRRLAGGGPDAAVTPRRTRRAAPAKTLKVLNDERRKLLDLYYAGRISAEGFQQEETRIASAIEAARQQSALEGNEEQLKSDLEVRFEEVAGILANLDMDAMWAEANDRERRTLVENLIEGIKVFPDHLEVKVVGSPSINVLFSEVGLKVPENVGVVGGT